MPADPTPISPPFNTPTGEPSRTILHRHWHAARARAAGLRDPERPLFSALLDSVESAWGHVRILQHLHDQLRPTATGTLAHLLAFVDADVCGLFRDVAFHMAVFVPEPGGGIEGEPDFNNTDADATHFGILAAVLCSATCDPQLNPATAALVRRSAEALAVWYVDAQPTLRSAVNAVQGS